MNYVRKSERSTRQFQKSALVLALMTALCWTSCRTQKETLSHDITRDSVATKHEAATDLSVSAATVYETTTLYVNDSTRAVTTRTIEYSRKNNIVITAEDSTRYHSKDTLNYRNTVGQKRDGDIGAPTPAVSVPLLAAIAIAIVIIIITRWRS